MFDDHIIILILLNFKFDLDRNQMWSNNSCWADERNLSLLQDFSFDLLNTSNHIVILLQVVCSPWKSERIWIHGYPRKNILDQIIPSEYFFRQAFEMILMFTNNDYYWKLTVGEESSDQDYFLVAESWQDLYFQKFFVFVLDKAFRQEQMTLGHEYILGRRSHDISYRMGTKNLVHLPF